MRDGGQQKREGKGGMAGCRVEACFLEAVTQTPPLQSSRPLSGRLKRSPMRHGLWYTLVVTVKGTNPQSHQCPVGPRLPLILGLRLT